VSLLLRLYLDALLENKPLVVIPTLVVGGTLGIVAISIGVLQRDTASIVMMAVVALMILVLLVVGIVDRKTNPQRKNKAKTRPMQNAGPGTTARAGRR
jgi:hypothetical protein